MKSDFVAKIDPGRGTDLFAMTNLKKARATELVPDVANQNDLVALVLEPLGGDLLFFFDESDHADGRGGIDHSGGALII